MKLSKQVKPISYLKAHASEVIREVNETYTPVVVTQNGEAKAIVQDLESYEKTQESLAMLKILAQSRKSKDKGKSKSLSKTFQTIKKNIKIYNEL